MRPRWPPPGRSQAPTALLLSRALSSLRRAAARIRCVGSPPCRLRHLGEEVAHLVYLGALTGNDCPGERDC